MRTLKQKNFYVLTIADDLIYFETEKEAEEYTKNFPKGTYKIGRN